MNKNMLIAYAMDFAKELVESEKDIRNIVLFGSVARGEFDKESDIDLFVDTPGFNKSKEQNLRKILKKFLSSKISENWGLRGVKNSISMIVGDLNAKEWASLHRSIISNGIVLFGKYKERPENLSHMIIFSYGKIKNEKTRVNVHRRLFGYMVDGKAYPGLVEKLGGQKTGPGTFMMPIENSSAVTKLFKEAKVTAKVYEIWVD